MIVWELFAIYWKEPIGPAIPAVDLILGQDPQVAVLIFRQARMSIGVQTVALRVRAEFPFRVVGEALPFGRPQKPTAGPPDHPEKPTGKNPVRLALLNGTKRTPSKRTKPS